MLVAPTSVVGFGFRSGKLERVSGLPPKEDIDRRDGNVCLVP